MVKYIFHSRNVWLILAVFLQVSALLAMMLDNAPSGFGVVTLWIAPILFLVGLVCPFFHLNEKQIAKTEWLNIRKFSLRENGALASSTLALITYILTLEPTASLWDCSETIAAAYKLQVPHTPGTPLTLLLGRLFSMLALNDVHKVAWAINSMAAFFSSMAVGLTFLITWHFSSSLFKSEKVKLVGSLTAALCLAFSDSFWFSAVEAETYGPSIFFMLLLVWLTIKGCRQNKEGKSRQILIISYLTGLSYCIHPMCILVLPVCFLIWRFYEKKWDWKQGILFFALGVFCVLFISRIVAVHLFEWAFNLDLILVNKLSLPFYSGVLLLAIILGSLLCFVWKKFTKARQPVVALLLILAGFTPYLMLFIRSAKLPPINEFSPNNLAKIKPYMNRENYPSQPLIFGPYYDAKVTDVQTKAKAYVVDGTNYRSVGTIPVYQYEKHRKTILPRMYSNDPSHIATYRKWTGLGVNEKPRFSDNFKFMVRYQLGEMYARYFMWNFAGRISDHQHTGWLKPWQGLPSRSSSGYNKASNQYFMLPFFLGIIGALAHFRKKKSDFFINLTFFLITGIVLAIYLNGTPNEPRERDYIYAGSFVSFCFWIGLGTMQIASYIKPKVMHLMWGLLAIPVWVLYQNYDDHNRANRTFQIDYARSILDSCEKNAILFTGGDNDTFPLWYLQEVEGFRTDVRVKVMSYFNADWYINQLSRKYYNSPPFKLTLQNGSNQYGPYDPIYIQEHSKSPLRWEKYMDAVNNKNPAIKIQNGRTELFFLPSRKINIETKKGVMQLNVSGSYLPKSEIAILDLIHSNDWERPIYFNYTSINSLRTDLRSHVVKEGLVYRLQPVQNKGGEIPLNVERTHKNLIDKLDYSNLKNSDVYFNFEDYLSRMINPLRFTTNELIRDYVLNGKSEEANELIHFALESMYPSHLEPSYAHIQLSGLLLSIGRKEEAERLLNQAFSFYIDCIKFQVNVGISPSPNDILVLQEALRLMDDPQAEKTFNEVLYGIS